MTDKQLAEAQEQIQVLRERIRGHLSEDLGGDPEDYNSEQYLSEQGEASADGGD